jgi:hypothetical protein
MLADRSCHIGSLALAGNGYGRLMTDMPYDENGRVAVAEAPGWHYLPFQSEGDARTITVVRDGDGCRLQFTVPAIVQRGEELSRIAALVIGAQERADRSEGLGA